MSSNFRSYLPTDSIYESERKLKTSTPKPKHTSFDNNLTTDLTNDSKEGFHNTDKKSYARPCTFRHGGISHDRSGDMCVGSGIKHHAKYGGISENSEIQHHNRPGDVSHNSGIQHHGRSGEISDISDDSENSFVSLKTKYIQAKLKLQWFEEWATLLEADNLDYQPPELPVFSDICDNSESDKILEIEATFKNIVTRFLEHKLLWESVHQLYEKCSHRDLSSLFGTEFHDYFHHNTKIALLQITNLELCLEDKLDPQNRNIVKNCRNCDRTNEERSNAKELHNEQIQNLLSEKEELRRRLQEKEKVLAMESMEKEKVLREKEQLLTRLSEIMGHQFIDNNPTVTDLSDENRPVKLAENFGELYDNEWTDAMEKLNATEMSEERAIEILLNILQEIYSICHAVNVHQRQHLRECLGLCTYSDELPCGSAISHNHSPIEEKLSKGQVNGFMKSTAGRSLELVKKIILRPGKFRDTFCDQIELCKNYVDNCITLCWQMNTHDVPIVPVFKLEHGAKFATNLFRNYTRSGDTTDFIVWPALLLHENGPILYRGVGQPIGCAKTPIDKK